MNPDLLKLLGLGGGGGLFPSPANSWEAGTTLDYGSPLGNALGVDLNLDKDAKKGILGGVKDLGKAFGPGEVKPGATAAHTPAGQARMAGSEPGKLPENLTWTPSAARRRPESPFAAPAAAGGPGDRNWRLWG